MLFNIRAEAPSIVKKRIEVNHALMMFFVCFLIDEKEGVSSPSASLVVAAEPTISPTSPIKSITAG